MSNNTDPTALSPQSLSLIVRLLNSAEGRIARSMLVEAFANVVDELLAGGWLVPHNRQSMCRDEHTTYIDVVCVWDAELQDYRCYEEEPDEEHWPMEPVTDYVLDEWCWLKWLKVQLDISDFYRITPLAQERCWYLGATRIDGQRLHVYTVKQLHDTETQQALLELVEREAGRVPALFISTWPELPPLLTLPGDRLLVPLEDLLLRSSQRAQLDKTAWQTIARRLCGTSSNQDLEGTDNNRLQVSSDYRLVRWQGHDHRLTKTQAAVVKTLHQSGKSMHKDALCSAADTSMPLHHVFRNKVQKRYVSHPLWKTLIRHDGNGYYILSPPIES